MSAHRPGERSLSEKETTPMALPDEIIVAPTEQVGQTLLPDHFEYLAGSGISRRTSVPLR